MRRRLTTSILALVAATLLLAAVAGIYVARRDAISTARSQLVSEAQVIVEHPAVLALRHRPASAARHPVCCVALLRELGGYTALRIARVVGAGSSRPVFSGLPTGLTPPRSAARAVVSGRRVSGDQSSLVYAIFPLSLRPGELRELRRPLTSDEVTVLVATRQVTLPARGLGPYLLIGVVVLVLATLVAFWLANRFARPLAQAVDVTGRIAGGAFESRVARAPRGVPELDALGQSINAMAEDLEHARAQQQRFLLSVSHDLRTPLTSIRGYTEAIEDGAAPRPEVAATIISEEAARLERLVQDLLDLARLDARTFSLRPRPVDVASVVRAAAEGARRAVPDDRVTISVEHTDGEVLALADPDRLRQLLANLLDNAVRFARRAVVVGAASTDGGALLWVSDDGPGIPSEDLTRVFQPYFTTGGSDGHPGGSSGTIDGRRSSPGSGSGLGLAIVQELAVAMGGEVRAQSPTGNAGGTRFTVRLPSNGKDLRL